MNSRGKEKILQDRPTAQYITLAIIIIIAIIVFLLIFFVLKPNLKDKTVVTVPPAPGTNGTGCPTSDAPINLNSSQTDLTKPSQVLSWSAVLSATTNGESILGYNIYISRFQNITKSLNPIFTVVPTKKITSDANGSLIGNTQYYWKVATVDTCGIGALSNEATFTTI